MSNSWIVIFITFSLILMVLGYSQNAHLAHSQTGLSSARNISVSNSISGEDQFMNIEYPLFWDKHEIPDIKGVLFLSPLKTVGVIVQDIQDSNITSDELYTNLLILMRQNLADLNILDNNSTKNLDGSNLDSIEYSYGNNSTTFKILQMMETGNGHIYSLTYFAEDVFYDSFLPIVSTMKTTFFDLNQNEQPVIRDPLVENITIIQNRSMTEGLQKNNSELVANNQPVQNASNVSRTLLYNNPFLGISFEYPSSLNKTEADNGVAFFFDQGTSGIAIGVIPSSTSSLENYTNEHISNFRSNWENFTVTNTTQVNLFDNPTQLLSFNYDNNSRLYEGREYITMDGNDAYIFTYFSEADTFDKYFSLFSEFIESTQLRNLPRIN